MKRQWTRTLSVIMTVVLLLAMAAFAAAEETPQYGGTLVIAYNQEPDTMNVYSTHLLADVQTCVIQGLVIPDHDMNYVPVLCKEVPTLENGLIQLSEDGQTMTITYNLRENVKWHDGVPFTSADVKYTWEAVKDEAFIAEGKEGSDDIESIELPDDYTVVCHYNKVVADFATTLFTFGIMPKHVCEGTDLNLQSGYNREGFIGTGPYKFVQWVEGEYIELARNEDYYKEGGYIDTIIFKFVPDYNTQLTQLKTGEVQFAMGLPTDMYEELASLPGIVTEAAPLNAWGHIDFNFKNEILGNNLTVRRALNYLTDKQGYVDDLMLGLPVVTNSIWMPTDKYHNDNLPEHEYSIEKAIALLEEDGWMPGADGVREKDGQRLEFMFLGRTGQPDEAKIQQVFAEACAQAGIKININNMDNSAMSSLRMSGDYDLKMHRWITGSASRTRFYSNVAFAPLSVNDVFYDNQEITDLLVASDTMLDFDERKATLDKVQELLLEDMATIPVYQHAQIVAHTDKLHGFVSNPTNMTHFWDVGEWWLEQ